LAHTRFAIRQTIAEKAEQPRESRIRRHRMMRLRIERVVDGHAASRTEPRVLLYYRLPAAVGEHEVVAGHEICERIARVARQPLQRRRCVDVPECNEGSRLAQSQHPTLEQIVVHADTAGLYDKIRRPRGFQRAMYSGDICRI